MNLLSAKLYDPTTAATFGTAASAMAAFDTTNLRITFTVPPSGFVRVVICVTIHGATTYSQILLGVMNAAAVTAKIAPEVAQNGTALATTLLRARADFVVPGLSPGASLTWDAAWGIETFVTSSLIKYGGPANATANNDFGAAQFEIWDAQPLTTTGQLLVDANGRVDVIKIAGTTQTARDLGASVLLSTGVGTGQLDFTSGVVKTNVTQVDSAALTAHAAGKLPADVLTWNGATAPYVAADSTNGQAIIPVVPAFPHLIASWAGYSANTFVASNDLFGLDDTPKGCLCVLLWPSSGGTAQVRIITSYVASTLTYTVAPPWQYPPDTNTAKLLILVGGPGSLAAIEAGALATHAVGMVPADVRDIAGSAVSTAAAQLGVNVVTNGDKTGYALTNAARIAKNTALNNFPFYMIDSADHVSGKAGLGLTITATRSIDGAAFAPCANGATELASGVYLINLATTDLNGNTITLMFTATGADARIVTIVTQTD